VDINSDLEQAFYAIPLSDQTLERNSAMSYQHDPQGQRLPIKLDATSNGEFEPIELDPNSQYANTLAQELADKNAKYCGLKRRDFLITACGAASTLLAFNQARASSGQTGGYYALSKNSMYDPQLAAAELGGHEFIFDVQGHYVRPGGAKTLKAGCAASVDPVQREYMKCIGADEFIKDVFLDSDTDMMVLSFVPSKRDAEPLSIEEADATRRIVEQMEGTHRLMIHGRVNPNQEGDIEDMDMLAEKWGVSAWKCYTQWGPDGKGFYLNDDVGHRFIEKARKLGVKNIAIHKGIPFGAKSYEHSLCNDIGPVARQYPDVNFLIYHSGWVPGKAERAFDSEHNEGIDSLVKSVIENDVANKNVYAELGSTWRGLMRDPDSAAHGLGKLIKYLGENNVLWGTDSVWYGSPQDQILGFRAFQISEKLREQFGYAEMTPELRAKIFGLNATVPYGISAEEIKKRAGKDRVSQKRHAYLENPDPHFLTKGPKNRREFLQLLRLNGGQPV